MKSLKISVIITVIVIAFLCSGFVAALTQDQGTARALFTTEVLQAGQPATASIFFGNLASDSVTVTAVSLHFDWMPTGQVVGYQLTTPVTIESHGTNLFDAMQVQIPLTLTSGIHTYTIGIDGTENGATLSWDSPALNIDVVGGTGNVTAAPSNTNSGGQPTGQTDLLLYGGVGAAIIIIALLIVVLMMRKRRTQPKSQAKQGPSQPENPSSESPEKKPNPEQDFNI